MKYCRQRFQLLQERYKKRQELLGALPCMLWMRFPMPFGCVELWLLHLLFGVSPWCPDCSQLVLPGLQLSALTALLSPRIARAGELDASREEQAAKYAKKYAAELAGQAAGQGSGKQHERQQQEQGPG